METADLTQQLLSHLCFFANASRLPEVITPMSKGQGVKTVLLATYLTRKLLFKSLILPHHLSLTESYTTMAFALHGKLDLNHAIKTGYAVYEREHSNSLQKTSFCLSFSGSCFHKCLDKTLQKFLGRILASEIVHLELQKAVKDFVVILWSRILLYNNHNWINNHQKLHAGLTFIFQSLRKGSAIKRHKM